MVLPPANQVQQRICSEWYNQQAGTYSAPIGMSASVCQMLPEATSSNSSAPPAQHYVCLNGTINNVQVRAAAREWCAVSHMHTLLLTHSQQHTVLCTVN
jgi:hypothetical protein